MKTKSANEMEDFNDFLFTCQRYRGLTLSSSSSSSSASSSSSSRTSLMLVEHLPSLRTHNRLDPAKQQAFHALLTNFLNQPNAMPCAIVYSGNTEQAPSPADLEQMFSQEVLRHAQTTVLKSKAITAPSCRRVL
jgi:hypothetical protein